jgi:glycyl-tRNA synthetase beta subunit
MRWSNWLSCVNRLMPSSINDKELRINRLTMLEKLRELFLRVADISLLQ